MTDSIQDPLRGTGRTTNRILTLVRTAIANTCVVVKCKDHVDSLQHNAHVANQVCKILEILTVDHRRHSLTEVMVLPMKKEQNDS